MEKLIRPKELSKKLGVSIPTLYRLMKSPEFPDRIRISAQAVGFRESEILEWIELRREQTHQTETA